MALKKPSDFFEKKEKIINTLDINHDESLHYELTKVESLSEQLNQLQQEITQKVIKNDLEVLVLSEINRMRGNFEELKLQIHQSNETDIIEFNERVHELAEIVNNLTNVEIPNYKKKIIKNDFLVREKVSEFQQSIEENINNIRVEVENKFSNITEFIDDNIEYFNQQLLETSSQVKKTAETYTNLSKIVEGRISRENEQLEGYSQIIENIQNEFNELQYSLNEKVLKHQKTVEETIHNFQKDLQEKNQENFNNYKEQFDDIQNVLENSIDNLSEKYHKDIADVKTEILINEKHIKNVDKYLQEYHQDLIVLKEEVFNEIENLPLSNLQENLERLEKKIDYIKETYSNIEPEILIKEVVQESNFTEPSSTKNKDPLTPLNQNFVTLDQLQQHYRLFLNRIQQQLSTLGGGGETRLEFLDDVDRNSAKTNGHILQYDSSVGKFIGTSYVSNSGGDAFYTGIVTASAFVGDGSGLTGIVAAGSGVEVKDNNTLVGTASTLNFGQDLDVTFAGGVATINVSIPLSALTDVNTSNLTGISTDYLMVYDPSVPGFKFVNPKTYFGINNDANPDPTIDDFGSY